MKLGILSLSLGALFALGTVSAIAAEQNFQGAVAQPTGKVSETVSQLQILFPKEMVKKDALKVVCSPAVEGFSSWADNNRMWTYNFRAATEYASPRLAGGSKCQVTQTEDLTAADGTLWKTGTIAYDVLVSGPNVVGAYAAYGFDGSLRDSEPVLMLLFDGPVNREKFFEQQNGYLSYASANAPSEKMPFVPVPADKEKELFAHFKRTQYVDTNFENGNWILVTIKQNLIPGSKVNVIVEKQISANNEDVQSEQRFARELTVRSQFEAKIQCTTPSASNANCLPRSPISVVFNGKVKWADVRSSFIEYVPYKSQDGKPVRAYPELAENDEESSWNKFFNFVAEYVPFFARFSETLVDSITFNIKPEAQTQATVVLAANLHDIEGRALSNPIAEFHLRIGSMKEIIRVPQTLSFFEKVIPNLYLPVGIVNLNQTLHVRKTGMDAKEWLPITEVSSMINIIRAYEIRGEYREVPEYVSPLEQLHVQSTKADIKLQGQRDRDLFLQFPFAAQQGKKVGGFYAIEISSPTFESAHSDAEENRFLNPKYVLAQVTDLAVHVKKGQTANLAWVTSLSGSQPIAGATVEIYNCLGQPVQKLTTDASGLVSFPTQEWATDCEKPENVWSPFFAKEEFFVVARTADDQTLTHTSWLSPNSYAFGAPGVEYFYSDISDSRPHFHSVVGVNLVKPGQKVPIQLIAKLPVTTGFTELADSKLPQQARIVNNDDQDLFYEFPLNWKNGTAEILWNVPSDSSVKIGAYSVQLIQAGAEAPIRVTAGEIEVAEFKIPLMTGLISFPNQALVRPDSIPVSSVIRYANGVGAKNVAVDISYFFDPTSLQNEKLAEFSFGNGPVKLTDNDENRSPVLPVSTRPATITGLSTGEDGSISSDIALEKLADGRTIAEALKTVDRPQKMVVRVRYQDQMGEYQTLSQAKEIYNATQYVGTNLKSGKRADAKLRAAILDVKGKIVTTLEDLELKVLKVETRVIGEEIFGGLIRNTIERELRPTMWKDNCVLIDQVATCTVGNLPAGSYAFQGTSKSSQQVSHTMFKVDSEGRVYGSDEYYDFGDEEGNKQLPLALNKATYRDGEKAVVSFPAPFKSCRALVSVERNDVMNAFVVNNACEKGFVEVPVNANQAPNAFVSVYAITGRADSTAIRPGEMDFGRPTYRLGFANMKVDWSRFKANVVVKTDKEKYEPGQMVDVQVAVQPEEGKLSDATVTVIAIEEKILDLKQNDSYKILDALMQLRGHAVEMVTPLERIETQTAESDLPSESARKGGDDGGDGGAQEFRRKLFDALVTFQTKVPVVNGLAKVSFKSNDSVTRFKVFAIATDAGQKFGTGETVYLTEKDTQSFSNIPTVAHTGDAYPVKVTVQNNSGKDGVFTAEVTVVIKDSNGKVIETKKLKKQVSIRNASSTPVDVGQMEVGEDASRVEYVVRVYNEEGRLVDVIEPEPQTILPSVPVAVQDAYIMQMQNGSLTQELTKNADALPGKGEIRVSVAKSLVNTALDRIVDRMNRDVFSDFFVHTKLYKALLRGSESKPEETKKILESLLGSLDSEGFLKYYPQARRGDVWLTASVINALQEKPWALKLLPTAAATKLKAAVSQVLTKSVDPIYIGKTDMEWLRAQAVMGRAAYAFDDQALRAAAQAVSTSFTSRLNQNPTAFGEPVVKWSNSDLLDVWLLQVYAGGSKSKNSPLYTQLTSPSRLVYTGNTAAMTGTPRFTYCYSDETIETAKLLLGHSRIGGEDRVARALAAGIVNSSQKAWYVSETMMNVAYGLTAFGKRYESAAVTGTAQVNVSELAQVTTVDWSKTNVADVKAPWLESKATVNVTQTGAGKPWVGIQAASAVPLKAPQGQGLSIEKSIRNINREDGFKTGDVIEVTLKISASSTVRHIAANDPIPAGSNIVGEAYGSFSSGEKTYSGYRLYFEELPIGLTTVKYQYQLNNPGVFKLPPTRAEGLYMPGVFGETPNASMTIE